MFGKCPGALDGLLLGVVGADGLGGVLEFDVPGVIGIYDVVLESWHGINSLMGYEMILP